MNLTCSVVWTGNSLNNTCGFQTFHTIQNNFSTVVSTGYFSQVYKVTDEALIAETAVRPNFFLMNIFFALKGSKLFIIIYIFSISAIFHFGFYGRILVQIVLVPSPMTAYPLLPRRFGMTRW